MIESFFGLLDMPRPKFMASVTPQITATLRKHDRDLFEHIAQTFQARKLLAQANPKSGGRSGAGGQSDEAHFAELLEETVLRLFVGTLNIDCCCYVWDQCLMLGSFERMVPNYCVAMLVLLRENIIKADTPSQIMRRISSQACTISPRRMQGLAERLFMSALRKDLGISVVNTMGSKPGMELFDVVMREDRQWNGGVEGLDKGLAWNGFAMGDKWTGVHPNMGGRWVQGWSAGAGATKQGQEGQKAGSKKGQELAVEAADRRKDAMKSTKLKSAAELEKEFNQHLGGDWAKRQAAEKRRLQEERRQAVRRAERDLLMSEEERSMRTQSEKDADRNAKEKRYNELSAKRAKLRAENARKEAAKFRNEEAEKKALRDRDDQRSRNEELQAMEKERRDELGQTGVAGAPYLGKADAPVMTLKLKDGGLERKLAIRALTGDDTVDGDGMARVEHALHEANLPLSKTGQILKLLHKFSKTRAGYVEKKASEMIDTHSEKLGPTEAEMKSSSPDGKGSMPLGNQVSPPAGKEKGGTKSAPAEFSYFGDEKAPLMKISLSTKTKKMGGKKVKIKLEMFTLVPGDTLVDAKIRVEKAFNVANPDDLLDPKKVQKIVDALVKQSVKKKTGWNEMQAKKDESVYTSINHKRRAEAGGGDNGGGGGSGSGAAKSSPKPDAASSKVADKSRAMTDKAAKADATGTPPDAGKIFSHTFQDGSIGLGLDMIFGSNSGNGVEVHRIAPGRQADAVNNDPKTKTKIGIGDHLQKVANVDVSEMHLGNEDSGAMREILRASRPLTLTFKKCEHRIFSCEFPAGRIGLQLDDGPNTEGMGIQVMGVVAGTSAAKATPTIKVGDRLVHVSSHNITHLEYDQTMEYLQQEPRPITLTFRRMTRPGPSETASNAIEEAKEAHNSTQSPAAAAAIAAAKAASDSEEPHVPYKKEDPNNPTPRGGDNSSRPLVQATMRVMDALRQLALGSEREQQDTREQIKEENAALAEDMSVAEKKVFGNSGKPVQAVVDKMNPKQLKKYHTQIGKMKKLADGNFRKRQKKLRKERAKNILKLRKQMAVSTCVAVVALFCG